MAKNINDIVLIGAGNVATHLGRVFFKSGKSITQVFSRTNASANLLASEINAVAVERADQIVADADLYIIAVPDDQIQNVVSSVNFGNSLVVHTSGSVHMDALKNASSSYGVLYPLQTFSKTRDVDFLDIPLCIEASDDKVYESMILLANEISNEVRKINSAQRQSIHLAAVFASNFTNYMYSIADQILEKENISFDILKPLIRETARKIETIAPADAQTGPAIRRDMNIIEKHIQDLQDEPGKLVAYKIISKLISDGHW